MITLGIWLQVLFWFIYLFLFGFDTFFIFSLVGLEPSFWIGSLIYTVIYYGAMLFCGIILLLYWYSWRSMVLHNRMKFIVTGVLGMFILGFLPGFFILFGGIIAEKKGVKKDQPIIESGSNHRKMKRSEECQFCGAKVLDPHATYCARCGGFLEEDTENTE